MRMTSSKDTFDVAGPKFWTVCGYVELHSIQKAAWCIMTAAIFRRVTKVFICKEQNLG